MVAALQTGLDLDSSVGTVKMEGLHFLSLIEICAALGIISAKMNQKPLIQQIV